MARESNFQPKFSKILRLTVWPPSLAGPQPSQT
jgi:hypothetical protein